MSAKAPSKPVLIFDGDCGFCRYWVEYWRDLTHESVVYEPYQQAGKRYPQIPYESFKGAIKYITPDGKVSSAAEASFKVLSHAKGKRFWLKLYNNVPGFKFASETVYAFIAKHRPLFHKLSLFLWGRGYQPPRFDTVSWIFLRLLGLVFFGAFVSFAVQAQGLIGSNGLLPLQTFMENMTAQMGAARFRLIPMVFWINGSDAAIQAVCWGGALVSVLLTIGVLQRTSLVILCALYLSLIYAGQTFMSFQWDLYLVETGFVAFLMCLSVVPGIWLLRWLLFRFMFMGGAVKLLSGDPTWRDYTALDYHFLTQPLPTQLAWYAHHLPHEILAFATGATLFIELLIPFLIFFPRRLRFFSAFMIIFFQTIILLTGNYNFFNLLTILLCFVCFDDAAIRKIISWTRPRILEPSKICSYTVAFCGFWIILVSAVQMDLRLGGILPKPFMVATGVIQPLRLVNLYGPFSVMTTVRNEIVLEGSNDGQNWKEYEFIYKPGDLKRAPFFNIPHQPRLDWQMWFGALGSYQQNPWFVALVQRLLENEPTVTALLKTNPFPDKAPKYVRAMFYDYKFTTPEEAKNGAWWTRELKGYYLPQAELKTSPFRQEGDIVQ